MIYEELTLRPSSGALEHDAITAWLASQDHAFLDPVHGEVWVLCADRDGVERARRERLADPSRLHVEVAVLLLPECVSVNAHLAGAAEPRALELIRWLVREGGWTVQRDQSPPEPVGDPARLFPADIEVPDLIASSVTEGVRHEWYVSGRSFLVHSSGQFRAAVDDRTWRGYLTDAALRAWTAAAAFTFPDDSAVLEYANPDTATGRFDVETADGPETAFFDDIPDALRPLAALVDCWLDELTGSSPSSPSTFVRRLRDD